MSKALKPVVCRDKKARVPADMIAACRNGRVERVRKHVEAGASVNGLEKKDGHRPLPAAAAAGKLDVARLLLDLGADANLKDDFGEPPLARAAAKGHLTVVKLLLDRGALVNLQGTVRTAIAQSADAGHFAIVKELMSRGAKPGVRGLHDALVCAIDNGHEDIAIFLLDQGWPPRPPALENAIWRESSSVVKRLIAVGARESQNALYNAIVLDKERLALEILKAGAGNTRVRFVNALHAAVARGFASIVKAMIENQTDLNQLDDVDIVEPPSAQQLKAARDKGRRLPKNAAPLLLKRTTALIVAVRCNRKEIVQLLLKGGADPGVTDSEKMTALAWAQKLGREDMISLLHR